MATSGTREWGGWEAAAGRARNAPVVLEAGHLELGAGEDRQARRSSE